MKNKFLNIACISTLSLVTSVCCGQTKTTVCHDSVITANQTLIATKDTARFTHFLAMETEENLKAYHLGLKTLLPQHHIPSRQDLFNAIYSHSQFLGLLTQSEALERFHKGQEPFILFEDKKDDPGHFYIIHPGGLRHFTVNTMTIPGIDNGGNGGYISIESFVTSTLV